MHCGVFVKDLLQSVQLHGHLHRHRLLLFAAIIVGPSERTNSQRLEGTFEWPLLGSGADVMTIMMMIIMMLIDIICIILEVIRR